MPNKEISGGIQAVPKLFNQTLLLGFVEINHHVTAEYNVVAARQELGLQVVKVELHEFFQLWLDGILVGRFLEIPEPARVIHRFHLLLGVKTFLTSTQAGIADVRSNDFYSPSRRASSARPSLLVNSR